MFAPGGPVVEIQAYKAGDAGSILGQGNKIPHAPSVARRKKKYWKTNKLLLPVAKGHSWVRCFSKNLHIMGTLESQAQVQGLMIRKDLRKP